jgi:HSP20 family protein
MNLVLRNRHGFPMPFAFHRTPAAGSFDRLLDSVVEDYFAPQKSKTAGATTAPRINVTESEKEYVVEAEMPGVTKENVKISVDGNHVTLEAEVKREAEKKEGETIVFSERSVQKFVRSFTLSAEVNNESSVARLEHGILTLTLPKKMQLQPKHIQVQ